MGIFRKFLKNDKFDIEIGQDLITLQSPEPAIIESITKRHRAVLSNALKDIQNKIIQNNAELDRLQEEYFRRTSEIKSDNDEYSLSLRALEASIEVFEKEEKQIPKAFYSNPDDMGD